MEAVYILLLASGLTKIGHTRKFYQRMQTHRSTYGAFILIGAFAGTRKQERIIHHALRKFRVAPGPGGPPFEHFALPADLVDAIKEHYSDTTPRFLSALPKGCRAQHMRA